MCEKVEQNNESPLDAFDRSILENDDIFNAFDEILSKQAREINIKKDERVSVSENDNVALWTWGIYNCKGIVLVYKNSETNEIFYSLQHCDPNSTPQMRIPEGYELLEKHWFDGPRPDERIEWMDEDARRHFKNIQTTGQDTSTVIKQKSENREVRAIGISINPKAKKIYVLNFYSETN